MDDLIREMITPPRTGVDPARRRRLAATAVTVALAAAGITSLTTGALFTDTETLTGSEFTTGTVQISPEMSGTVTLGAADMAPGDTSYGLVDVVNSGSLAQRYAVSLLATDDDPAVPLTGELELAAYLTSTCSAAGVATLTPVATFDGLPTTATALLGDPATGQDATGGGDRFLPTGATESLCFTLHVPLATTNAFQGAGASLELRFDAEQTANNP
ncbi:hypothetical protein ICW40_16135 [Actinotalea ferrariae]|uniref:TasA family protein n=1 Tax=Actinotalea ferrariae TaxID=1386098 RepID=UPI001C8CAB9D|nr:TasA family protein [Actinotalea ferrariae]MBX9246323.1 hypothetical protein [Actinotalea ferrariae]